MHTCYETSKASGGEKQGKAVSPAPKPNSISIRGFPSLYDVKWQRGSSDIEDEAGREVRDV